MSFNRTIVELKRISLDDVKDEFFSFNRTIVELKPMHSARVFAEQLLLIVLS